MSQFKPLPQQAPSWLAEDEVESRGGGIPAKHNGQGSSSSVGALAGAHPQSALSAAEQDEANARKAVMVSYGTKALTLVFCVLIFATAIVRLETIKISEGGQVFVAAYMLFFSTLLFVFEAMQSQPIVWLDHMLRRNFGFLYNPVGKAFFLIFIAILCLGLDGDLSVAVGLAATAFGGAQIALYLKNPALFAAAMNPAGLEQQQPQNGVNSRA